MSSLYMLSSINHLVTVWYNRSTTMCLVHYVSAYVHIPTVLFHDVSKAQHSSTRTLSQYMVITILFVIIYYC